MEQTLFERLGNVLKPDVDLHEYEFIMHKGRRLIVGDKVHVSKNKILFNEPVNSVITSCKGSLDGEVLLFSVMDKDGNLSIVKIK